MRKLLPIIGIGCASALVLALIVTGAVMLLHGLDKTASDSAPERAEQRSLTEARKGFNTHATRGNRPRFAAEPEPPLDLLAQITNYTSPTVGVLRAYQSKDPQDGQRHPAVVWAHGGFGGISRAEWDRSRLLREDDFVTVCPSFRGEHRNPGQHEMLYGEVEDLLAAVSYTAHLPYVDPQRVYIVGHDEGGTLALLAAETGTELPRAVFAIGGLVSLRGDVAHAGRLQQLPFPFPDEPREWQLRSPAVFAGAIRKPTFYIGPASRPETREARLVAQTAQRAGAPVYAIALADGSLEDSINLILPRMRADTGPVCKIHFDESPSDEE